MIRIPDEHDLASIKKDIEENNGAVGYVKIVDNMTPEETVKMLIESEREFLGDGFLFEYEDLCYEYDPEVKNGLIVKMKPEIYKMMEELIYKK